MLIGLFYIIVPLLLISILAFKRQSGMLMWALTLLSFGSAIAYLWATARWEMVSIYFRSIIPVLFLIACVLGYKRIKKPVFAPKKIAVFLGIALYLVLIVFFSGFNWFTYRGYLSPANTMDIVSPFHSGKQIVLHGGASPFINGHFHVKPQTYALDIVGLNKWGMRASSFQGGADLNDYVIFGQDIYSPVHGTVIGLEDKYEDQAPPQTDTEHLAGNYILIQSEGVEVLLAHLKYGSIAVKQGDKVSPQTLLGQVGNTGNTSEPHLHIHVEKGGEANTILNGTAVPFTMNKRFLVRGDILKRGKR